MVKEFTSAYGMHTAVLAICSTSTLIYNWFKSEVTLAEEHAKAIIIAVENQLDKLKLHDKFQKLESDTIAASHTLSNATHNKFDSLVEKLKKIEAKIENSKVYAEVSADIKKAQDKVKSLDIEGKLRKLEASLEDTKVGKAIINELNKDLAILKLHSADFHLKAPIKMLNGVFNAHKNAEVEEKLAVIANGLSTKEMETIVIPTLVIKAMTCCSKEGVQLSGNEHCGLSIGDWQAEYNFPPNSCLLINEYCDHTQGCISY